MRCFFLQEKDGKGSITAVRAERGWVELVCLIRSDGGVVLFPCPQEPLLMLLPAGHLAGIYSVL